MAQGDLQFFDRFILDLHNPAVGHDLVAGSPDVIKVAVIRSTATPATTTADPRWGAGGTTNFSTHQVTTTANYLTGGKTIANFLVSLNAGAVEYNGDDITAWSQHASGDTDATWGIVYNDTLAGKQCLGWIDLGGPFNMAGGTLDINITNPMAIMNQA